MKFGICLFEKGNPKYITTSTVGEEKFFGLLGIGKISVYDDIVPFSIFEELARDVAHIHIFEVYKDFFIVVFRCKTRQSIHQVLRGEITKSYFVVILVFFIMENIFFLNLGGTKPLPIFQQLFGFLNFLICLKKKFV